jgi:creatinase
MEVDMRNSLPEFFSFQNGLKAPLAFSDAEYAGRLARAREVLKAEALDAIVFTSMHNIAFVSGFLYCAFGRPYACVVTLDQAVTVAANIDGGQPNRRSALEALTYTDWTRDNFWRAVVSITGTGRRIGVEGDHLTLSGRAGLEAFLTPDDVVDIAPALMRQRMIKSPEEIRLIREGARIADIGGAAAVAEIRVDKREIEIAMAARDAMEVEIAKCFPDSEIRDSWVWLQSGLNTDGAHNPVTTRRLEEGDILSLNTFPMISGYYTALERTLFLKEPDRRSREIWEANVATHELGLSMIRVGARCGDICQALNDFLEDRGLLRYRSFGYGHSFGLLSHYYGREAGLELREDIDTVLQPGMVISMEPMLRIPKNESGAGGYREHDIVVLTEGGPENITGFPYGPAHNIL